MLDTLGGVSIAKSVADKIGVAYRQCDMKREDQDERQSHPEREAYWLGQIEDRLGSTVLFICGAEHIKSFGSLLRENGGTTEVLCDHFGREIYAGITS